MKPKERLPGAAALAAVPHINASRVGLRGYARATRSPKQKRFYFSSHGREVQ